MTICPIAIAVGCKKCPAFKFCQLTYVLGDQQEEDDETDGWTVSQIDSSNKVWGEDFPMSDEHPDTIADKYQKYAEEELEKNKNGESEKE